ncbi:hypothetical protein HPS54_10420 [Prevotella sp. PCHR]|uniref:Uncharacterized protein n=1 Tax=Xylanibacter caecicola TaxID=2736294 RepID=A0ABX2B7H4_9BACT|nr:MULTISPECIES: hypothetical protein [Xylanibacter]NPE25925.1 hypothetical protein [Xylanibacter caecicola]
MKKRLYVRPVTEVVKVELGGFVCLSWDIENNKADVDDDKYIVPPTVAGDAVWSEKEDDGGGIWGDLD